MEEELRSRLSEVGVKTNEVILSRVADLRYKGQGHELHVQLPNGDFNKGYLDLIRAAFEAQYQTIFGRANPSVKVEAINWRLFGEGDSRPLPAHETKPGSSSGKIDAAQKGTRQVYFREFGEYRSTPVYDRYRILPDTIRNGPAVVEERESTVIVEPSGKFSLDKTGNLIIEIPE
jgi:N-methylhydantoinase A